MEDEFFLFTYFKHFKSFEDDPQSIPAEYYTMTDGNIAFATESDDHLEEFPIQLLIR